MRARPGVTAAAALTGLGLGALAVGPGRRPGYLLVYDMVFVPAPRFTATMFGLTGTLPRAVPSDAVITALAQVAPADLVQKVVLLAIFVLSCAGAARLLAGEPWPARLAAGVLYTWNPYVAERLLIGQWALLLGYAGLPWVLAAAMARPDGAAGWARWSGRLVVALLPAAVGGFAAMTISALVAIPAAALQPAGGWRRRAAAVTAALGALALLSLPWLIPSLTRTVRSSPAAVALFAARADTPFGAAGSVLLLGGEWNAQTVPAGYGGPVTLCWLCLVLVALAGYLLLGRGRWPGAGLAAVAGLGIALVGTVGPGQHLLQGMIGAWSGFAVLRDGQQFVAPLAVAEAGGLGLAVGWLLRARRPAGPRGNAAALRENAAVLAAALLIAPVAALPGLAFGAAGRLRPVQYPASWLAARRLINADSAPGSALVLPWAAYRRPAWNHGEAVLDPWPRLLTRTVIWNDGVQVGSVTLAPEDPAAAALAGLVTSGRPMTARLGAAGVRFVIDDAGQVSPAGTARWLPGCTVVYAAPGLIVYRIPERSS